VRAYETNASVGEDRHTDTKKKKKKFEISLYQDANISANNEYLSLHFCDIDFTTMRYTSLSLSLTTNVWLEFFFVRVHHFFDKLLCVIL
jgi:hypothetical protein